jgi:FG-GAP-like repeat
VRPLAGQFADLNGDAALDLVLGGTSVVAGSDTALIVYTGDGTGAFTEVWSDSVLGEVIDLEVGDVDGNGSIDFAAAGWFVDDLETHVTRVCRNVGVNSYVCSFPILTGDQRLWDTANLTLADIDNDTDLDMILPTFAQQPPFDPGHGARILINDGGGVFEDFGQVIPPDLDPSTSIIISAGVGDLDGNGTPDLLLSGFNIPDKVFLNDGTGIFSGTEQYLGQLATLTITLADIDGDNDLDFVAAGNMVGESGYLIFASDGFGSFTERESGVLDARDSVVADLDGDGDLDLVLVAFQSPDVIFLNRLTSSCQACDPSGKVCNPKDVDGDGICDTIDLNPITTSGMFSDGTTSGDITNIGDQIITVTDRPGYPACGVGIRVAADPSGGPNPALLSTCPPQGNATIQITAGDVFEYVCGSIEIDVTAGSLEIDFQTDTGTAASVVLDEYNGLSFDETMSLLSAPASNTQTLVVEINGEQFFLAPGESFVDGVIVPAVSQWGLITLTLLTLTAGTLILLRKRTTR